MKRFCMCFLLFLMETMILNSINPKAAEKDFILYAPDVNSAMQSSSFWIDQCPDAEEICMTQEEISQFNQFLLQDPKQGVKDLAGENIIFNGNERKETWCKAPLPEQMLYRDGRSLTLKDYQHYIENIRQSPGLDQQKILYGVCVKRTAVRCWPEDQCVSADPVDDYFDEFLLSYAGVNAFALIDGQTADQRFYHVILSDYEGWVLAEDFALFRSRADWLMFQTPEHVLVVTAPRLYLMPEQVLLTMGTVLPLMTAEEIQKNEENTCSWNCYVVKMPCRDGDGFFYQKSVAIPQNMDVNTAYLPLSKANILTQSFKFLGSCYGWGGSYDSVDCSMLVQEVYACFGLKLPRNAKGQSALPVDQLCFSPNLSVSERKVLLEELEPCSLLYFPGHIMLYLGEWQGNYYTLSAVGSMKDPDNEANILPVRKAVINTLNVKRKNGKIWLESLEKGFTLFHFLHNDDNI